MSTCRQSTASRAGAAASSVSTAVPMPPPVSTSDAVPRAATASTSRVTSRAATALASSGGVPVDDDLGSAHWFAISCSDSTPVSPSLASMASVAAAATTARLGRVRLDLVRETLFLGDPGRSPPRAEGCQREGVARRPHRLVRASLNSQASDSA